MKAYVSLWSADLLALSDAVTAVGGDADGFHLDVFDGHDVRDLLFGPEFVAALRAETEVLLDVHLNVEEPDYWAARHIEAGAGMVTVQASACTDVGATLRRIAGAGAATGLGLELSDPVELALELADSLDRVLVMATSIGVKGLGMDSGTPDRVRQLRQGFEGRKRRPEIVVDGGIRPHTVTELAAAGADGVVPGSLVFADPDPIAAIQRLHGLGGPTGAGR